jgi:hypothetical protein
VAEVHTLEQLPPLVSAQDIATASKGKFLAADDDVKDRAAEVTAHLRTEAGWHIAPVLDQTVHVEPIGSHLPLPTLRALRIVSVAAGERPLSWGALRRAGSIEAGVPADCGDVVVRFEHGFDEVPPELKRLGVQMALRALGSPLGVTREQIGQHSVSVALTGQNVAGQVVVLEGEQSVLARYRLPSLA